MARKFTLLVTKEDIETLRGASDEMHWRATDRLWTITKSNMTTEMVQERAQEIAEILKYVGESFDMMDIVSRADGVVRAFEDRNKSNKE